MATQRTPWRDAVASTSSRWQARSDEGQTMAEYAVVLGVLVLACVAAFPALAPVIRDLLQQAADVIRNA